jgi:hypothetical protein
MTKKQENFLLDSANDKIIDWEEVLNPGRDGKDISFFENCSIRLLEKIMNIKDDINENSFFLFMKRISRVNRNLTIEFLKKHRDYITFLTLSSPDDAAIIHQVDGVFYNLRNYVLHGKQKFAEQIVMELYDEFEEEIKHFESKRILVFDAGYSKIIQALYQFHISRSMSDSFKLFLEMK